MIIITVDQFGKAYYIYNSTRYFKQKESPFEMIIALKILMPKLSCKLKEGHIIQSKGAFD